MGRDTAVSPGGVLGRCLAWGWFALLPALVFGEVPGVGAVPPSKTERCPVCGMFVAGYSNWFAGVRFKDGSHATFDGPKDLLKYLTAMKKYEKKRTEADVAGIYVTDYYQVKPIDARRAFYVTKSDVNGPMGEEYVPFETQSAAAEFLRDHKGKSVVTFDEALAEVRAGRGQP